MKAAIQTAALAVTLGLAGTQLMHTPSTNPPVDPARSLWNDSNVHPSVAEVLRRACADCHSHETRWPWYSRIAPVSWMLEQHVRDGRAKLNFSEWSGQSQDQAEEIYDSVAKGKMPMAGYLFLHPNARLSAADRSLLQAWADGKLTTSASR